ncbi:MAG: hypothetical protein H0U92_08520 [Actinobacteria bacterium]|nr:hypothetical protein [Actinomycetota bacterium]
MRTLRAAVVLLAVLLLVAYAFAKLTSEDEPIGSTPGFGSGLSAVAVSTSTKIRLSPDASRVALVENGVVTVVRSRDGRRVMSAGSNVVDVAWMPDGGRVVIVEGPIPTGEIDAIDMTGTVVGVAKLTQSVEFGNGLGLAVNSRGTQAAVIAVTRDAVGGARHTDVALVDLQSGKTRVFATPVEEENPIFLDDQTIGFLADAAFYTRPAGLGPATKAGDGFSGGPYVVGPDGAAVLESGGAAHGLVALNATTSERRALRALPDDHRVVDVDTRLTRALVRITDRDATVHLSFDPLT